MTNRDRAGLVRSEASSARAALGRFAILFVVLVVVLPVVVDIVVPSNILYSIWVESTEGARLQQKYGFVLETRTIMVSKGSRLQLPVISEVVPGGPMAKLGVQAGDVVMCIPRGRSTFWNELLAADEGYEATLHLARPVDVARGCPAAKVVVFPGRQRPRTM